MSTSKHVVYLTEDVLDMQCAAGMYVHDQHTHVLPPKLIIAAATISLTEHLQVRSGKLLTCVGQLQGSQAAFCIQAVWAQQTDEPNDMPGTGQAIEGQSHVCCCIHQQDCMPAELWMFQFLVHST